MLNNGNEVEQHEQRNTENKDGKILEAIVSRQVTLDFQVPKIGMPILSAQKNEVSSSVTQFVSALSPFNLLSDMEKNARRARKNQEIIKRIKRKSEQFSAEALQNGLKKKRRWSRINRDVKRARASAEGWDIIPDKWAKNSVMMQMIRSALTQGASLRQGVIIQFKVDEQIAQYAQKDRQAVPNNNQFIQYVLSHPFVAFYKVFFSPKTRLRGWEDSLQILMWIFVNPPTVLIELTAKIIGAILTQPSRRVWLGIFNNKQDVLKCAGYSFFGIFTLPLWALGQAFFIFGNALGYSRRSLDAIINLLTIIVATFSGNREKYPHFLDCIGLLSINLMQLLVAYVGLTSLFLLIPNEATYPLAMLSLPLTQTALNVIPTVVKKLYLAIVEPLEMSKGTRLMGNLVAWMTVSPPLQIAEGLIETFMIKLRNNTIKNAFINCASWIKDKCSNRITSMPDLETAYIEETQLPLFPSSPTDYGSHEGIQMVEPRRRNHSNLSTTATLQTLIATSSSSSSSTSTSSMSSIASTNLTLNEPIPSHSLAFFNQGTSSLSLTETSPLPKETIDEKRPEFK